MLKTIAIAVAVVIASVLLYAATRPDDFLIERSVSIKATSEKILLPFMSDFHKGYLWSPCKKDPAMKRTFSGAASGKGAVYEFDGNKNVGKGRLEIVEAGAAGQGRAHPGHD